MERESITDYQIRQFRPDDRAGVLALDDVVWDRNRGEDWLEWKYESNPYLDHTPLFVVKRGDEVVGARPFMAFELRVGDRTVLALQPADTMVHPDHRRQGLFTRMNERAIEYYDGTDVEFFFNFPNEASRTGYEKLGWRTIERKQTYYRVQNPDAFVPKYTDGQTGRVLGRVLNPIVRGFNDFYRSEDGSGPPVEVKTTPGVDIETLSELYERNPPEKIHAHRTSTFYEWRFASPVWSRSTYVAHIEGEPTAALIARRRRTNDAITITQLVDIVPMTGGHHWRHTVKSLLEAAVDDHVSSDLIAVAGSVIPKELLASFGFYPDNRPPLSTFSGHRCTLTARPVDGNSWTVDGHKLDQPSNWLLTYAERDTT